MKNSPTTIVRRSNILVNLLYFGIFALIVCTLVCLGVNLGNGRGHNNVFGVFESTGAAIILVGMPYLFLQIIKHSRDHLY